MNGHFSSPCMCDVSTSFSLGFVWHWMCWTSFSCCLLLPCQASRYPTKKKIPVRNFQFVNFPVYFILWTINNWLTLNLSINEYKYSFIIQITLSNSRQTFLCCLHFNNNWVRLLSTTIESLNFQIYIPTNNIVELKLVDLFYVIYIWQYILITYTVF